MNLVDQEMTCRACGERVFGGGGEVVRCTKCGNYQHALCWAKTKKCSLKPPCDGGPLRVAVMEVLAPGPTAAEIAERVAGRIRDTVGPMLAELRAAMPDAAGLERVRGTVGQSAAEIVQRVESVRRELETRIARVEEAVEAVQRTIAAAKPPAGPAEIAEARDALGAKVDAAVGRSVGEIGAAVEALRVAISAELHGVLTEVEACRWDTAARRHPLPWDARVDDVLAPPPAQGREG